uniref:LigA n=1 Tax=Parastrongyloides trichosuri TaxID=131310 RepID=A0A0N4Z2U9_PARTI
MACGGNGDEFRQTFDETKKDRHQPVRHEFSVLFARVGGRVAPCGATRAGNDRLSPRRRPRRDPPHHHPVGGDGDDPDRDEGLCAGRFGLGVDPGQAGGFDAGPDRVAGDLRRRALGGPAAGRFASLWPRQGRGPGLPGAGGHGAGLQRLHRLGGGAAHLRPAPRHLGRMGDRRGRLVYRHHRRPGVDADAGGEEDRLAGGGGRPRPLRRRSGRQCRGADRRRLRRPAAGAGTGCGGGPGGRGLAGLGGVESVEGRGRSPAGPGRLGRGARRHRRCGD